MMRQFEQNQAKQMPYGKARGLLGSAILLCLAACAQPPLTPISAAGQPATRYSNGETYVGEMQGDLRTGQGTYTWPDGRKYVGTFRNGLPNGHGIYTFRNGDRYEGDFVDNHRTGQGTYTWPDGRKYVGAFRDDQPNGQGTYTAADGRQQVGQFRNGELVGSEAPLAAVAMRDAPTVPVGTGEIPLEKRRGTYVLQGIINDSQTLEFFLDSGSADVAVPAYVFEQLRRSGSIRDEELIGHESYVMANGQPRTGVTFLIRSLRLGAVVVENVRGSVMEYSGPALLGMSFLGRFGQWVVDSRRQVLVLR